MLEKLHIRNYRIFRDLEIDQLRRINLIAGRNNSGKTSLLEAIFLLARAGNPDMLGNVNVSRVDLDDKAPLGEIFWKPFFSNLDMSRSIEINACHTSHGALALEIAFERSPRIEIPMEYICGTPVANPPDKLTLTLRYSDSGGQDENYIAIQASQAKVTLPRIVAPIRSAFLKAQTTNNQDDAILLAGLRQQKRDHLLLEALQVIEPKLQSIEDNSASGTPMIWGDIGLSELIPLAVMGEGMTQLARSVLAISTAPDGVVLVDEIENGIHHSVLPKVWRAIDTAAKQFNTQIFATTHSRECVRAAHEALAEDDFRLHRLEANDDDNRCVTYDPESIASAIKFNFEVR